MGQNLKLVQMAKITKQPDGHGQTCKSVHSDLFVRPTVKGSKVKEVKNLKILQMAKITMSTCWAPVDMFIYMSKSS